MTDNFIAIQPHIWIIPVVVALLIAFTFFALSKARKEMAELREKSSYYRNDVSLVDGAWGLGVWLGSVFSVIGVFVTLFVLIPYNPQYWSYYRVSGTIESVTNTLDNGSGELSTLPVVTLKGLDLPITVNESRVMSLTGRDVDLTCTVEWVPYGLDQYRCGVAAIKG